MKLDLHCAVLATDEEDLNWIPFLVVAHEDEFMVERNAIDTHIDHFYEEFNTPENELLYDEDWDLYDEKRITEFLDYMDGLGYTVLKPGRVNYFARLPVHS